MNDWFEAEQRIERAQQLSESQRWAEALAEIDVALAINPSNAGWHAHRGYLLEELDRFDEAADAYHAALQLDDGDCEVSVAYGATLARMGRFSRALSVFEDLVKRFPDFEPAYCHLIGVYGELGRHDQAEEVFYLAQELNDSCPHCFFHVGASLAARGQMAKAIFCWQRVLEIDADYSGVNREIAQAYRSQGQFQLAREFYLREVRDDPGNIDLLFEIAELAVESGEVATAAAKFTQILELDPGHVDSRYRLGRIWLQRGQPGQALACFEAIRSLSHEGVTLPGFELRMGQALFALGRYAEARKELDSAVAADGSCTEALSLLGDCAIGLDRPVEAADAFRRVLAIDAHDADAQHKLALCLMREGRFDIGLVHARKALRVRPDDPTIQYTTIVGCLQSAEWADARTLLRKAFKAAPDNPRFTELQRRFWSFRLRHYWSMMVRVWRVITLR